MAADKTGVRLQRTRFIREQQGWWLKLKAPRFSERFYKYYMKKY